MEKYDFTPQPKDLLKKRKRKEVSLKNKHHKGAKLSIRKEVLDLFYKGKTVKDIIKEYP